MNFVPAHRLGLSALEFFESLDSETDPSLSDLFRVFDRFGKRCGDQCPIFGIELERFFEDLFDMTCPPVLPSSSVGMPAPTRDLGRSSRPR